MSSENEILLVRLLNQLSARDVEVNLNHYILQDLRIYGNDFQDLIDRFLEIRKTHISKQNYDGILKVVPSEWYGVFGGIFYRQKKDITVKGLLGKMEKMMAGGGKGSESV